MKRVAVLLLVVLAAGAGGPGREHAAFAKPAPAYAVLALVDDSTQTKLAWLDPRTLKRIQTDAAPIGEGRAPVLSPAGKKVAVGGPSARGLRIVDVNRMKIVARIARREGTWSVTPLAWTQARCLYVLESEERSHTDNLLVVDPVDRRILTRRPLEAWTAFARAGRELVFVTQPAEGIGSAQLTVAAPDGTLRTVVLERIPAGGEVGEAGADGEFDYRIAQPGVAVDPASRIAYVVGAAPVVASVDLASLAVTYRELSEQTSLLARLASWLQPTAQAKSVTGWQRQAVWLRDGLFAVSGLDYDRLRTIPAGLRLIDTRTWAVRMLEPGASSLVTAAPYVLAAGAARDAVTDTETGIGIRAYTIDGLPRWQALGDEPVWWVQAAGGFAYAAGPVAYPPIVRVIDLATGAIRTVRRQLPVFVTSP
jgi:hypothetical protein